MHVKNFNNHQSWFELRKCINREHCGISPYPCIRVKFVVGPKIGELFPTETCDCISHPWLHSYWETKMLKSRLTYEGVRHLGKLGMFPLEVVGAKETGAWLKLKAHDTGWSGPHDRATVESSSTPSIWRGNGTRFDVLSGIQQHYNLMRKIIPKEVFVRKMWPCKKEAPGYTVGG